MSEFRRQHWAAAVDQVFHVVRRNFIYLIVIFFVGNSNSEGNIFWYVLLGGLVFSFFSGLLSWFLFKYRIDGSELHIKKGILIRKDLYLSKDRIQVIDITEGIVQRIFGLVKVEIKTAGSGTAGATISAITSEEAEQLRTELRNGHDATTADTISDESSPAEENHKDEVLDQWRISQADLVMAAFTSGNFGLIASILGAAAGQLDMFINEENVDYIMDLLPGLNNTALIITVVIAIVVVSWVVSFLGVIFKYGDFSITKKENELLITSGIIERKHTTIPFNRIQAVRFVEGILRQPLGYGMVYVENAGFEVDQKERSIVLVPYIARDDLGLFFNRFLPDYEIPELDTRPPKRAFFRYLRRPNYVLALAVIVLSFFWELWWVPALAFLPLTVIGYLRYHDAGLHTDSRMIMLRYRNLARITAFVLRKRIQVINEKVNPFQSRKDLATVKVVAASGAQGIDFEIQDLEYSDSAELRNWLLSRDTAN